jgi:lipopolysaccharide transport system permease protein
MRVESPGSLKSFIEGVKRRDLWLYLADQIISSRFRNSKLGTLWLVLQNLAFSAGAGYIWSQIFHTDPRFFIPFVGVGFAVWGFISTCYVDGSFALVAAGGYLKQLPIPQSVFLIRYVLAHVIFMSVALATALATAFVLGVRMGWGSLYAIPGLLLVIVAMFGTVTTFSYLGARFRDVPHALQSVFQFLFVLTPVIYSPDILIKKGLGWAVYINPFNAFLDVVRTPIMYGTPATAISYGMAALYIVVFTLSSIIIYRLSASKLVYEL